MTDVHIPTANTEQVAKILGQYNRGLLSLDDLINELIDVRNSGEVVADHHRAEDSRLAWSASNVRPATDAEVLAGIERGIETGQFIEYKDGMNLADLL